MAQIAFFGTPQFAVPILYGLKDSLSMVVCQPDKPKNRGQKIEPVPVKAAANDLNIPVFQPTSLKSGTPDGDQFYEEFKQLEPDLAIVVAYGRLIPKRFLEIPRLGFVNIHASLLPRWRGAAPIQRAIEAGDTKTGVCLMQMTPELDAGDVYLSREIPIEPDDDSVSLAQKLSLLGRDLIVDALPDLLAQKLPNTPQPQVGITYAKPITKEEGQIDWSKSAQEIFNQYRAMQPWPGVFSFHNGNMVKLFGATVLNRENPAPPGTISFIRPNLVIATGRGEIAFSEAQLPNKRKMLIGELINGYSIREGDRLAGFSSNLPKT